MSAKKTTRRKRPNGSARRRNQEGPALVPMGEFINVEKVRFNENGTADIVIKDSELRDMPMSAENRGRRKKKSKNAKRKKKKSSTVKWSRELGRYFKDFGVNKQLMPKGWKPSAKNARKKKRR